MQIGGADPGIIFDAIGISDDFIFRPDGTETVRFKGDKVGIGSEIPTQKLDVTGTILTRSNTNTATFSYNTLRFQTSGGAHIDHGTTNQNLNFRVSKSSTADTNMMQINAASEQTKFHKQILLGLQGGGDTTVIGGGSGIGAYIQLNYATNSIVNTKLMGNNTSWLNSHYGNLGIGTQTADQKFQVQTGTHKFISFTDAEHGSLSTLGSAIMFSRPQDGAKKICGIFQHTNQSLGIGARDDLTFHTGGNAFYSSGTERLRITSTGKTIISSPNAVAQTPVAILDVFNQGSTTQALRVYRNDLNDNTLAAFQSYHNAMGIVDKMVITSRGKVGINTDNPQRELHVKPWDNNPATAAPGYIRIEGQGANQPGILEFYHTRSNGSDKWPSSIESVDAGLSFKVATGANGAPQTVFRITQQKEVGIGTDNPQYQFDLFNEAAASSGTSPVLSIRNGYQGTADQANALKSEIRFSHRNHNSAHEFMATRIIADTTDNYMQRTFLRFLVANTNNGTERLTINPYGKVGINSTSPNATLVVQEHEDNNPSLRMYRQSTGGDIAALIWSTAAGNQAMINYRGGGGDTGMQFYTSGTGSSNQRLRISTNGQILQFATAGDNLFVTQSTGNAGSNGDYFFYLFAQNKGGTNVGSMGIVRDTANDDSRIVFSTATGGTNTERLRITSTGNTRIGVPANVGSSTLIDEKQATIGTKHFYTVYHNFSTTNSPLAVNSKIPTNSCGTVEIMAGWANGNGITYKKFCWASSGNVSGCTQVYATGASRYGVSTSVGTPTMSISGDYVNFSFTFSDSQGNKMEKLKIHFEYFNQFRTDG